MKRTCTNSPTLVPRKITALILQAFISDNEHIMKNLHSRARAPPFIIVILFLSGFPRTHGLKDSHRRFQLKASIRSVVPPSKTTFKNSKEKIIMKVNNIALNRICLGC